MTWGPPPLPTKVKVGWKDYRIEVWHPQQATSARRYGETCSLTQVIRIDTSFSAAKNAETLLHEILHCVHEIWNIQDGDDEERTVMGIGLGLSTVWRDNPDVMAWIDTCLTAKAATGEELPGGLPPAKS